MRRTTRIVALCLFVFLAAAEAQAATYLSKWENKTSCSYVIHNSAAVVLEKGATRDFGTGWMDPDKLLGGKVDYIDESCPGGPVPFKLVQSTGFANKKCAGVDPGPFKITTSYKGRSAVAEHCYCITSLRIGYIDVKLEGDRVVLTNAAGTYACTN